MKFKIFILLAINLVTYKALACSYIEVQPNEYYLYRAYDPKSENLKDSITIEMNLKEWQKLMGDEVSLIEIYDVVYKWSYDEICNSWNHKFWKKIKDPIEDYEFIRFLILAKNVELIRSMRNSRWYYPGMKGENGQRTLEELAFEALFYRGKLAHRYRLQAVRALFSLGKYQECIYLWETECSEWDEDDLMRRMIEPYIIGAKTRLKRAEGDIEYFAKNEDVESVMYLMGVSRQNLSINFRIIDTLYKYNPNSSAISKLLQDPVKKMELIGWDRDEVQPYIDKLLEWAESKNSNNTALYYYTAAYMEEVILQDYLKGSIYIAKAQNSKCSEFLKESIKVLSIYHDAATSRYDDAYEKRLFEQLKWLDNKIVNNLTPEVIDETKQEYGDLYQRLSYYYWNDMMRKITLGVLGPRLFEQGETTRALQLMNMGENRLKQLVGKVKIYYDDKEYSLYDYRRKFHNQEYHNYFFTLTEMSNSTQLEDYYYNTVNSKTAFDTFLNSRSNVEKDYLCDIIATHALREMKYEKAVKWFNKISSHFSGYLNLEEYFIYDPFQRPEYKAEGNTNRINFARKMAELEKEINTTKDVNIKAKDMIEFSIGLKNSFGLCWPLTQYYKGYGIHYNDEWVKWDQAQIEAANQRADNMKKEALEMMTDRELKASTLFYLGYYIDLYKNYLDTNTGEYFRTHCDTYEYYKNNY